MYLDYDTVTPAGQRYRLLGKLGSGAFGEVYRAEQKAFGLTLREVALKLFTNDYVTESNAEAVFGEALLIARLEAVAGGGIAPPLVRVYDVGVLAEDQTPYVAMELMRGSLARLLRSDGLPLRTVVEHARRICEALEVVHGAGFMHLDLKPANVLVGTGRQIKLADFGVARDRIQALFGAGGTVSYMPFEAATPGAASPAFDIFSLGICITEMLLGANPLERLREITAFGVDTPQSPVERERSLKRLEDGYSSISELTDPVTGVPFARQCTELRSHPRLAALLKRCLALKANDRPGVEEVKRILDRCLDDLSSSDGPADAVAAEEPASLEEAESQFRQGEAERAEETLRRVLRDQPNHWEALGGLAAILGRQGRLEEAIVVQKRANLETYSVSGRDRLIALYEAAGQPHDAEVIRLMFGDRAGPSDRWGHP